MKRIAIFASGNGTNAQNIIHYFSLNPEVKVECIICNNPKAGVLNVAANAEVPYYLVTKNDLFESDRVLDLLKSSNIDLVVLAGFLWLIPENILKEYAHKIINIHPALLPRHGGAGMYGMKVHDAVLRAGEKETGITIHYVDKNFDEGEILFQQSVAINENDTNETIRQKVHRLEYEWYPKIIEKLISKK